MKKKPVQILFSNDAKRTMLHLSKKLVGCYRPEVGSINHFVSYAVKDLMKKMGIREQYINEMFDGEN